MTSDTWESQTFAIELPCGRFRITVVQEEGRPHKVFPSEMAMIKPCMDRLLSIIVELAADLGHKKACKILHGMSCDVVRNNETKVISCTDEIAKVLEKCNVH